MGYYAAVFFYIFGRGNLKIVPVTWNRGESKSDGTADKKFQKIFQPPARYYPEPNSISLELNSILIFRRI